MFPAASYPIVADRFAPHSDYIDVVGYDFTGATFEMSVRDNWNVGTERAAVTPTVSVTTLEGVPTSRVSWAVPEATMEAMPLNQADPSIDAELVYDLQITPSGGTKFIAWRGSFTVRSGAVE